MYKERVKDITLAGPSYFNPVLKEFYKTVSKLKNYKLYHVLLLITDGMIHDMDESTKTIIDLSQFPCSIIIVGLGIDDFTDM